jgi:oxygen-independent coproporphyrinogen-3 oxidase
MSSIYIHIPFCLKKCRYCDFYSVPLQEVLVEKYINSLLTEASLRGFTGTVVSTVYIGGGTPSLLRPAQVKALMDGLRDYVQISEDCEITLEANPATLNSDKILAFMDCGINRLSLGVQSLNEGELTLLGRVHGPKEALLAIMQLQRAGLKNLSVDLIYGIPGQSVKDWLYTLKAIIDLRPQHISTYELTLTEGTELYDLVSKGIVSMPEEDTIEDLYFSAIDTLIGAGYEHYEISNFALPGFQCLHNLNYWRRGQYIGLGASAHSFDGKVRREIVADVHKYINSLSRGTLPFKETIAIDENDALKESIFLGLRTSDGIDRVLLNTGEEVLQYLVQDGLVCINDQQIRLTDKGMLLSNEVILRLTDNLQRPCLLD